MNIKRLQKQNEILMDALYSVQITQENAANILKNELMFKHGVVPRFGAS